LAAYGTSGNRILRRSDNTVTYIVADPATAEAAIAACVLDFNPKSARTSTRSAYRLIEAVRWQDLDVEWILETHVHADHLSAAPYIKDKLGGGGMRATQRSGDIGVDVPILGADWVREIQYCHARRLWPPRSRRGDPACTRRMAPPYARAPRTKKSSRTGELAAMRSISWPP
jgi:glyoxylase-like metal-dependent hydrolase (beta-lactamase superfamily II)